MSHWGYTISETLSFFRKRKTEHKRSSHTVCEGLKTVARGSWLQACLAWCLKDRKAEQRWNVNTGQHQSKQPFVSGWQEVVTLPCLEPGLCAECNLWGCWFSFRSHQAEDRWVLFLRHHGLWCYPFFPKRAGGKHLIQVLQFKSISIHFSISWSKWHKQ